jgi:hypothetical protein
MKENCIKAISRIATASALALSVFAASSSNAQDIELFTGTNPANTNKPNVLIIIDNTSNWGQNVGGKPAWDSELVALSTTVQQLLVNGFGDKIRIGMMLGIPGGYKLPSLYGSGSGDGGYVRFSIRDMNSTNAAQLSGLALGIRDRMLNVSNAQSIEGANIPRHRRLLALQQILLGGKYLSAHEVVRGNGRHTTVDTMPGDECRQPTR